MKQSSTSGKGRGISFRPKSDIQQRLEDLAEATERPKTFFLDKALEAHLPELEMRYANELRELKERIGGHYELNDSPPEPGRPTDEVNSPRTETPHSDPKRPVVIGKEFQNVPERARRYRAAQAKNPAPPSESQSGDVSKSE